MTPLSGLFLLLASGGSVPIAPPPEVAPITVRILRRGSGSVEVVPLEDYIAAVIPAEIGAAPPAALEAQAVAARSFALARWQRHADEGADLCDGTHCQVFPGLSAATDASIHAAQATRGLVLVQKGRVIGAPFHASCGGRTVRPVDVWDDEEMPDLVAVVDDACLESRSTSWTFRIPRGSVPLLSRTLGLPAARFLEVYGRNGDGRVAMVRFAAPGGRSLVVSGFEFRRAALRLWGPSSVRSTSFEMAETKEEYLLAGRGAGHGAGLCQVGAIARARRGESRDAILALYYRGAAVKDVRSMNLPARRAAGPSSPARAAGR